MKLLDNLISNIQYNKKNQFWLFFAIGILRIFFQAIEFLDIAETRFIVLIEVLALLYVVLKDKGRKKKMKKDTYY